jgi:PIN domain nuclease of toxin-antitoxin system
MILLDTHVWVWLVNGSPELTSAKQEILASNESQGLGISAISCWEVAKLVERGRLVLSLPVGVWVDQALAYPGIRLVPLSPRIAVTSTQLPQPFHKDPADQIIVATARELDSPLATNDGKLLSYPHMKLCWLD